MESNEAKIYTFPALKKKIKSEASKKRTRRINAFITDLFFIQVFQKMAIFAYIEFVNQSLFTLPLSVKSKLVGNLFEIGQATFIATYFGYYLISSYLFEGKTIGKSLFHLRVVNPETEGEQLSFRDSLLRTIGYTISFLTIVVPLIPISKLGGASVILYSLFSFTVLTVALRKLDSGLADFLSQTEVMTDEQYEQYLIGRKNLAINETSEEKALQIPDGPAEQLDLFAA